MVQLPNGTHMPEVTAKPYRRGDAAMIPVDEADPFGFWLVEMEANCKGLTSYYIDDLLAAVTGYELMWRGVAYAFALVNRPLCSGSGKELAAAVRDRITQLMEQDGLHRVQATSHVTDRAAAVFLRATGYKLESRMVRGAPDGTDLLMHAIIRSANQ